MMLGKKYGNNVCLFEKEWKLGGRCHDIKTDLSPDWEGSTYSGTYLGIGARRVIEGQFVTNLSAELGVILEKGFDQQFQEQFLFARNEYHLANENNWSLKFAHLYPKLPIDKTSNLDITAQLNNKLFSSPKRKHILEYPNLWSYIRDVIGDVGLQFLQEMGRFKGEYKDSKSASSFIDYLEDGEKLNYKHDLYPVGGMSEYPIKMAQKAVSSGVRNYSSQPIISIEKLKNSGYELKSKKRRISAQRIILALPPTDLINIQGELIESIVSQKEFQVIKGSPAITVTEWFDQPWWKEIKTISSNISVWRAWTTDSCIGSFEIPKEASLQNINAFRTAYTDQVDCVQHFRFLNNRNQTELVEEVHYGLETLLEENNITNQVKIPKSKKVVVKEWPAAWHFQKEGSPYTNKHIKQWAINPLEGEKIGLASEAYNMQQASWIEGAVMSAANLLKNIYDVK